MIIAPSYRHRGFCLRCGKVFYGVNFQKFCGKTCRKFPTLETTARERLEEQLKKVKERIQAESEPKRLAELEKRRSALVEGIEKSKNL